MRPVVYALFILTGVVACSSDPVASPDIGFDSDTSTADAGPDSTSDVAAVKDTDVVQDADFDIAEQTDATDADPANSDGFGVITGTCDVFEQELTTTAPTIVENAIDFGDNPYDDTDRVALTDGGRRILDEGNAGGSSVFSELFSYEVVARCNGAELLKTESNIVYDTQGSITDYLVQFDDNKIGVSVTRVFSFPRSAPFDQQNATNLVTRKLEGILESSENVAAEDAWSKQILHLITDTEEGAVGLTQLVPTIDASIRADTVVIITVTDGADDPIYEE